MPKKKTHENFINEMEIINPNINIIGKYINAKTRIECECKKCGYIWMPTPDTLCSGRGCPKCCGKMRRTHDDFISNINKNIEVLSQYINAHSRVECKCKKCGHIWNTIPDDLIRGSGCPKCANNLKKTTEIYKMELKTTNPNLELLNEYTGNHKKIHYKCKICNYDGYTDAANLLSGHGCRKCGIENAKHKQRKSHENFVKEMSKINSNINICGIYINNTTRVVCECKICAHKWNPLPNNLLKGYGCPNCNMSSLEQTVYTYLSSNKLDFIQQYTYPDLLGINNGFLSYDFYLSKYNLLIECQGVQHEKPIDYFGGVEKFKIQQEHDIRKRNYAKSNDICLLEIWYYDFEDVENILDKELDIISSSFLLK